MTLAWVEVVIRLVQFGCGLLLFGLPAFAVYRRRAWVEAGRTGQPFRASLIAAVLGLVLASVAATLALTVNMYGTPTDALKVEALWSVLTGLQVGVALAVRLGLTTVFLFVLAVLPEADAKQPVLLVIGGLIVAGFAWSGHGAATVGPWASVRLVADIIHLLAAAIWIGALVALTPVLARVSSPQDVACARDDLKAFSGLGTAAVLVIVVTGLINSAVLIGLDRVGQMTTDRYGQILISKIALFGVMLGLAAANRFVLVPRLERQGLGSASALSRLKISVGVETMLGFLVLLAVAVMGRIAPMTGG